jgi:hypothetical protein
VAFGEGGRKIRELLTRDSSQTVHDGYCDVWKFGAHFNNGNGGNDPQERDLLLR